MLVGYVSDEYFTAIPDVLVDFASPGGVVQARSSASGAIVADLAPGTYQVTLAKPGFSAKQTSLTVPAGQLRQFRLLSTAVNGYAWPKWIRSGESSELCINCAEPFSVELWRYGLQPEHIRDVGYWDDHPPGAMQQILPDGDFTQTGAQWSRHGYAYPSFDPRTSVTAPERSGLYYFHATGESGAVLLVPAGVAPPAPPQATVAVLASTNTWNAYNAFGGRSNYIIAARMLDVPIVNSGRTCRVTSSAITASGRATASSRRSRSTGPSRTITSPRAWNAATRSRAARRATWPRPSGGCSAGWNARGFGYDLYSEVQLHERLLDLVRVPGAGAQHPPRILERRDVPPGPALGS